MHLSFGTIATFLSGSTVMGILGHAVQTFPTPANKYGAWLLGTLQWAVGQRERAANTLAGNDTVTDPIQRGHQ